MNLLLYIYLGLINIFTIIIMFIDKRRAIKKEWRISEKSLFILSIIGGSIGCLLGMYFFRHKTKHAKFYIGIPVIIIFQIILIIYITLNYIVKN